MEITPITGLVFGIEHHENPNVEDDDEDWAWAYILHLFIVRIAVIKYK